MAGKRTQTKGGTERAASAGRTAARPLAKSCADAQARADYLNFIRSLARSAARTDHAAEARITGAQG